MKKAFITGITGQDGSYLAEFLIAKGYEVYGLIRPSANTGQKCLYINRWLNNGQLKLAVGDLLDEKSLIDNLNWIRPDEIYNLAAISYIPYSWTQPEYVFNVNSLGVLRLLNSMKLVCPEAKFYQASSSEMFGNSLEFPQKETTPFDPSSPYAISKVTAHQLVTNYRDSYDIFACCGILFNHESPRRGYDFVTRKVTNAVARIKLGLQKELVLGNLQAKRDWGYAKDYVEAMWLMLQQDYPKDYVIGTGQQYSIKELVGLAFDYIGLNWENYVKTDKSLNRPVDVNSLLADYSGAKNDLKWEPKTSFKELIYMMIDNDLLLTRKYQ